MTDPDDRRPSHRNDQYPAKTDEPFTEQLFGDSGLRVVHFAIYTLVFVVGTVLLDALFAGIRTLVILVLNFVGLAQDIWGASNPVEKADATITMLYGQSMLDVKVLGAAVFTSFLVTLLVFYWNEIRYQRGEWLRTFL